MRRFILALLVFLFACPSFAAWKNCTQAMVDAGKPISGCTSTDQMVFRLKGKSQDMKDARAALCVDYLYQETVECTQELVDAGDCTAPDLGTQVSNPQSCGRFSSLWIRGLFFRAVVGVEGTDAGSSADSAARVAAEARLQDLLSEDP